MSTRTTIEKIKSKIDLISYATQRLGGNAESLPGGETRITGARHGGLTIKSDDGVWYLHSGGVGGDAIELAGHALFGTAWNRHDPAHFRAALADAATFADIEIDENAPEIPGYVHTATYQYHDDTGALVYRKLRYDPLDDGQKKFFYQRPDGQSGLGDTVPVVYRLPDVLEAIEAGEIICVAEGEKCVDLLADLGLRATCHPCGGKAEWEDEWIDVLGRAADLVLLPDNDDTGRSHMTALADALHGRAARIRVLELPDLQEKGDIADWIAAGGSLDRFREICDETPEYSGISPTPPRPPSRVIESLRSDVTKTLSKRLDRKKRQKLAEKISEFLAGEDRLLKTSALGSVAPYMICLDGSVVPMMRQPSSSIRLTLHELGFNTSEQAFKWVYEHLVNEAMVRGRDVSLENWSAVKGNRLYVSSGVSQMIVGEMKNGATFLRLEPNGYDGVLFTASTCYPEWSPGAPVAPSSVPALSPFLEAPPEAQEYTPDVQRHLLYSWLVAQMLGVSPRPIVTHIGTKEGGKSLMAREVMRMWLGPDANVSQIPNSARDFMACATSLPIYGIDNLDGNPDKWMLDALAMTATGGHVQERLLYANSEIHRRRVEAGIVVTTRTATFANRPDIRDRVVPIFFRPIEDSEKVDDRHLASELQRHRGGVLSYLMTWAVEVIGSSRIARGLPSRFQEYARIVTHHDYDFGISCLKALERAQGLAVTDNDELLEAILNYSGTFPIIGTATEILALLQADSGDLPFQGGGKAAGRKIREMKDGLALAGYDLSWVPRNNTTYFCIRQLQE